MCKYAFPDCVLNEGVAVGLPLCQQDCIALKHHFCYKDWALIEDNKRRGIFIDSRGHFRLPKCDILPAHDNSTTNDKACTRSSITAMRWDLATSTIFIFICLLIVENILLDILSIETYAIYSIFFSKLCKRIWSVLSWLRQQNSIRDTLRRMVF